MAWNPKALKQNQIQIKGKRGLDRLDMEAEAEGGAIRTAKREQLQPQLGRRISRQTRELDGRRKTADNMATRNIVKDTAAALEAHRATSYRQLAQN